MNADAKYMAVNDVLQYIGPVHPAAPYIVGHYISIRAASSKDEPDELDLDAEHVPIQRVDEPARASKITVRVLLSPKPRFRSRLNPREMSRQSFRFEMYESDYEALPTRNFEHMDEYI